MKTFNTNNDSDSFLAQWLDGELSDNELKNLVSEEDFNYYLKIRKGIEVSERLNSSVDGNFAKIQNRIASKKQKVKPLYVNWGIGIAASIVLLFGLFMFLNNNDITVETGFGESKSVVLLDGSEVILNSKSKVSYNESQWGNERVLSLDGEAYFKVAKGKTFTVETNNGSVKVLGTQFNVISKNNFFDVVCYEGKVGVKILESEHILLPNDAVRKVNGYPSEETKNFFKKPTWIDGESTFKSVPVRYVIRALEDQYEISFDTKAINQEDIYTGSFPHNNLDLALKTVFETLNITYTEKEKRNIKLRYKE
ncbi:FecR family protein [Winogradskyella luteola]|uniref:FecR family protein n=1 Tax=Winogradskyella luteola TaxID=2828330 RepID=A0A9X1JM22_9FLAO|nr:FecR family protein [Winogradskyella luteola]MBV7267821.1 FecR family protein [Winogradskyella luteola]